MSFAPQYLRIQALSLVRTGEPDLIRAGQSLTVRFLREYPRDWQVALVHGLRAEAHEALDEILAALNFYRHAMAAERQRPNVQSNAWLEFGWLVVRRNLTSLFSEADSFLDEFATRSLPFPILRYRYHSIRAIVAAHKGFASKAKEEAALALAAAAATHSGFQYHAHLGLVSGAQDEVRQQLQMLAAG